MRYMSKKLNPNNDPSVKLKSYIDQIYKGYVHQTIFCTKCENTSRNF